MKKIGLIFGILYFSLLISNVLSADWEISLKPGDWSTKSLNVVCTAGNYTLSLTSSLQGIIINLPEYLNYTIDSGKTINPYIVLPKDASGTYIGFIKYCDAFEESVVITVNTTTTTTSTTEPKPCMSNIIIDVLPYGAHGAGTKFWFFIRNKTNNQRLGGTISFIGTEIETVPDNCPSGICDFRVPTTQIDDIVATVEIENCGISDPIVIPVRESEGSVNKPTLSVSCPSTVTVNKNFICTVIDGDGSLVTGASGRIVNTETGVGISSVSDSYGVMIFNLDDGGEYKLTVEKATYNSTQISLTANLPECPHECCKNSDKYQDKGCEADYECTENECVKKIKKPVNIICPEPQPDKVINCNLRDSATGELLASDIPGKLNYNNMTMPIVWSDGVLSLQSPRNSFSLTSDETSDYRAGLYSYQYKTDWLIWVVRIVIIVIVIAFIIIGLWFLLKKRGRGARVGYPSSEVEVEEIVPTL